MQFVAGGNAVGAPTTAGACVTTSRLRLTVDRAPIEDR
jgi:hypothetical protein